MISVAFFILSIALTRFVIALLNRFNPHYLTNNQIPDQAFVSILIPARNEENNLPALLKNLHNLDYDNKEVIIYNDQSTDRSGEILERGQMKYPWLRIIQGNDLPEGWTGKNHACNALAAEAKGEYLLFIDADVIFEPTAVKRAIATLEKQQLSLLSVFPEQIMRSTGERLTVPLMNWILLSLLPLILVRKSSLPSLSAANGQFMLFHAATYQKFHWHERFRDKVVEDILISRAAKKEGLKIGTFIGNHDIFCRMYQSGSQGVQGFSKNIHQFFGGSYLVLILFTIIVLSGFLWIYLAMPLWIFIIYLMLLTATEVLTSWTSRQNILLNLALHPGRMIFLFVITFTALVSHSRKKLSWKGRQIIIR
ncbi:MAG: glycosyltransferase family 2 protein [Bacteroidales bacterium]